jgi:hypothetical protein
MKKTRIIIQGDTVYEIDVRSKKPKHIIHGVDKYFKMRHDEHESENKGEDETGYSNEYEEEEEEEDKPIRSPNRKREDILKLMGNKKKLVTKADGLSKEIPVWENRRRKKCKSESKRKIIKKCGCKK